MTASRLEVGRIGRAHGLSGELAVTFTSDREERLIPGSVLYAEERRLVVTASRPHQHRWLVTFDRDYGELVYSRACPSPPAILYIRQEPYPVDRPAEWILSLLDNPADATGYMVVIGEQTIRRRPLPNRSS